MPRNKGKEIDTTIKLKNIYTLEEIAKEMDITLRAKINVDAALNVLKNKMNKIDIYYMNAKDYQ